MNEEDREMIKYFHTEKGDITRWCGWEDRRSIIEAECPELIAAMNNLKLADIALDSIVDRLGDDW